MRSKEEAHDYRYFPDPDLLPLELDAAFVDALAADLPELPDAKRPVSSPTTASPPMTPRSSSPTRETRTILRRRPGGARARREVGRQLADGRSLRARQCARRRGRRRGLGAASLASLVDLISEGVISGKIAKDLLVGCSRIDRGADPRALVEAHGLRQVSDVGAIDSAVDAVIAANPDKAEQAKAKPGMFGWFVGQVMKSTGGKANPQAVSDALKKRLGV